MWGKFNLDQKFSLFSEHWRPKVVAALNGQEVKIVKVRGTFPWHHHEREDELFLVWKGRFRVEFRDRCVDLGPGEGVAWNIALRPTRRLKSSCSNRRRRATPATSKIRPSRHPTA
jgi:hypothetical protein